jgi:hypothetical protein
VSRLSSARFGSLLFVVALAGVVTLAAFVDPVMIAAVVVLVQALVSLAPTLVAADGRVINSPRVVAGLAAGLVATVIVLAPHVIAGADGTSAAVIGASDSGALAGLVLGVAAGIFVAVGAQMVRRDGRADLVQSVSYAVMIATISTFAAGWVGAGQSLGEADVVAVSAAGAAAGVLAWSLPIAARLRAGLVLLAGAGAGAVLATLADSAMTGFFGVVAGGLCAVFAVVGLESGRTLIKGAAHPAVTGGFPGASAIAFAGPMAYIAGQLITVPTL